MAAFSGSHYSGVENHDAGSICPPGDLLVLVGTRKGAFVLTGDASRRDWKLSGIFSPGNDIFHLVYGNRAAGKLLAASNSMWFGPQVECSRDLGKTWEQANAQPTLSGKPKYAEHDGPTANRIWHIEPGGSDQPDALYAGVQPDALYAGVQPDALYAGVQPAALFKSTDGGVT